ncbi:LysM peptidoglycan-binding domain-containing protein [Paenibacillus glycanilyticus]|uniref:LysM domain-containing protein n=1 Tax=Paenibacillus glycanilyticus TaxID=126569 RepID=A0ABQ6GGX7_9BACL|nr:LysM peptidoglycan-binding domain-containing protein [Paenibacillus glycanilyticus]GLX69515.1 hypothetical protein MU1_38600 [Paenibacillus glycanilyticus]
MKIHVVKKGDTLYFIAQKHNVSIDDILKLNPSITNPDMLDVGMKLKVPSTSEAGGGTGGMDIMHQHVVKQGDTLWKLSKAWGVPLADMIKANPQLKNPNVLLTGEIVNIPKTATPTEMQSGGGVTAQGTGNAHHPLHPMSLMNGVQNWVGKKPTGVMPSAQTPAQKIPTAPIAPAGKTPTAPIVTPVAPAAKEPAKKALPVQKSPDKKAKHAEEAANVKPNMKPNMEANVQPKMKANVAPIMQSNAEPNLQPSVDLFKQFGVPAVEAASQHHHGGYGNNMAPMVSPMQVGPGFGYGYGGWPGSNVSPANEGPWCPPGTMPIAAGPGYGYGMGNVSPAVFGSENASPVLGADNVAPAALGDNAPANVSPAAVSPAMGGYGFVSPASVGPEYGYGYGPTAVSPAETGYGYGPSAVSPANVGPDFGHGYGYGPTAVSPAEMGPGYGWPGAVSPAEMGPGYGYGWPGAVSPASFGPDNVSPAALADNNAAPTFVSPEMTGPAGGYGYGPGWVSPAGMGPDYGYGYGHPGMVSPAEMGPDYGYGYGYGHPGMVSPEAMGPNVAPMALGSNVGPTALGSNVGPTALGSNVGPTALGSNAAPMALGSNVSPAGFAPMGYGYGYGNPVAGAQGFTPYSYWPGQTAGAQDDPCGCHGGKRIEEEPVEAEFASKKSKPRKTAKIRSVAPKSRKGNRNSQPWINR